MFLQTISSKSITTLNLIMNSNSLSSLSSNIMSYLTNNTKLKSINYNKAFYWKP